MTSTLSKRGGRDVARQFAHMHNIRVWHLEKRAADLAQGLSKFQTKISPTKSQLKKALSASSAAVESFFEGICAGAPKRRGMKKGVVSMLGYFIAHESHHRGSILLTLKECGHKVDQKVQYKIWDWDRM